MKDTKSISIKYISFKHKNIQKHKKKWKKLSILPEVIIKNKLFTCSCCYHFLSSLKTDVDSG